jgi:catechol 2,3-dioxygenase-like lactoylglutathione lyase family enzyme
MADRPAPSEGIVLGGGPTEDKPDVILGAEIHCYIRDPDGHLIEVGQSTP